MKTFLRIVCLTFCFVGSQVIARGACDAPPDLSTKILEFHARQISRIQGLLKFGAEHNLCFGIQVVDTALLTELVDIDISNPTSVQAVISKIMGSAHVVGVQTHYGVIEIVPTGRINKGETIFDYIIPNWEAQRANLQVVSWLLHVEVARDLNPRSEGFAGRGAVGDYQDAVGPFKERGLPVRFLLDKIVAQSRGSSWIAQVTGKQAEDLTMLKNRSAWVVLEYKRPEKEYAPLLNSIAAGLTVDPAADPGDKPPGNAP